MSSPIVCYPFVGDSVGGSHRSMVPVIRGIEALGFRPLVVLHRDGPLDRFFRNEQIAWSAAPDVRLVEGGAIASQALGAVRAAPALARFLRQQGVAIVHTNDARMHFTWGPAARLAGCRFVWHQRSAEPSRRLGHYSRLADVVITISEYCLSSFAPAMAVRAVVIKDPNELGATIDRAATRKSLLAELGCGEDAAIVGYVANLTRQKRPDFFLEIARAVYANLGPAVRFPMFGEKRPGLAEEIEARIGVLGLGGVVRLMGPRYPIEPVIAGCDVLVAPATAEGLGRTLVEAMLVGTPVVAADDAGHREAIVDGLSGRLIAPDDAGGFADAVTGLVRDQTARSAITGRAADFARGEFSNAGHLDKLAAVYRDLTEASR